MRGAPPECSGEETPWIPSEGGWGSSKLLILKQLCLAGAGRDCGEQLGETGVNGLLRAQVGYSLRLARAKGVDLPVQVEVSDLGLEALQGAP